MWKNIVETDQSWMAVWRMHISCWIPVATNTYSEHLIPLFHCNNGCTNAPNVMLYVHCLSTPDDKFGKTLHLVFT